MSLCCRRQWKTVKGRRALSIALEQISTGIFGKRFVILEEPVRTVAAGVNDAFGDALMVEMKDLLAEMKIFDQGRPARPDLDGVLVVRNRAALRGGENGDIAVRDLMQFAALAAIELLIVNGRGTFAGAG